MRRLPAWILTLALAGTAALTARAEPVPDAEQIPVDVRRTTLIVRDVDRSLAFYRDALGLKLVYDQLIVRPGSCGGSARHAAQDAAGAAQGE